MYGLTLITGRPGASKTLNAIKMLVSDLDHKNRVVYYHNIRLMFLDYDVCNSFQGYFYGVYRPALTGSDVENYQLLMERVHNSRRLVELSDVPHLEQMYDAWRDGGGLELWVSWCRRVYPSSRIAPLNTYLAINPDADFSQLEQFNLHWIEFPDPTKWHLLPRPCRILIDECQRWFPPRKAGSGVDVPVHISEFETVRHSSGDVFLITQHPKLIDSNIRRLVVTHHHFVRPFGASRVRSYVFTGNEDDPDDFFAKQKADSQFVKTDSNFFGLYHSADSHTYKFRVPRKIWLLVFVMLLLVFIIYRIADRFFLGSDDESVQDTNIVQLDNLVPGAGHSPSEVFVNSPGLDQQFDMLPISALASVYHPLSSLCQGFSLAGYEDIRKAGRTTRRYYVNCETRELVVRTNNSDNSGSPGNGGGSGGSDGDNGSAFYRRLLFSFEDLAEYGFQFTVTNSMSPVLVYQGKKYLLISY